MEGGPADRPQVFVVDSQAPVTLRPSVVKRDFSKKKKYMLYLLVGLALLGVVIEAGFIYNLYKRPAAVPIPSPEKIIGHLDSHESNKIPPVQDKKPDYIKPAAFVQGLSVREDGVMLWQAQGLGSFLQKVGYEEGRLLIQTEGYYYIHSKVYFSESSCTLFKHQVKWRTARYKEDPTLMQALRYSCVDESSGDVGNSFLGGVFKLYKHDSVYVHVNNSRSVRNGVHDNFFGVFMI